MLNHAFDGYMKSGGLPGTFSLYVAYSRDSASAKLVNDARGKGGERHYSGLVEV